MSIERQLAPEPLNKHAGALHRDTVNRASTMLGRMTTMLAHDDQSEQQARQLRRFVTEDADLTGCSELEIL